MNLSDLTDPRAVEAALDEFDTIGRAEFLRKYGFGEAKSFFLVKDGKFYDSKAIVGAALTYQYPENDPLRAKDFSGGEDTVRRRLKRLGYEVVNKKDVQLPLKSEETNQDLAFTEILARILELQTKWTSANTSDMEKEANSLGKQDQML